MKPSVKKFFLYTGTSLLSLILLGIIGILGTYFYIAPKLPSIDTLKDVQLQVPLRIYTQTGELIAEYGEMKRSPLKFIEFPKQVVHAVLAAEDDRFFEHPGVDYQGILRAIYHLISTGERAQGGSTITMQVARNFFLSRERTYIRKLNEIFLAFKIENALTKQEILELYLNKIYMGKRSYGFAAAAQVYYGKLLQELSLAQIAMIAGLPKAPSKYNPITNIERATLRRNYVLRRMHELEYINTEAYKTTLLIPDDSRLHGQSIEVEAPYVAEMVRAEMLERFGNESYSAGFSVITTINGNYQKYANKALRSALLAYDRRHGYRGIEAHVDLFKTDLLSQPQARNELLAEYPRFGEMQAALVIQVNDQTAYAYTQDVGISYLPWEQLKWARKYIRDNHVGPPLKSAKQILKPGDIIYIYPATDGCVWLAKPPRVSGALVSIAPNDGAIYALVGGFDYYRNKFNRATQAKRQPGSSFKPFIYTAALDKGFTAASIINDAPVVFDAPGLEDIWRPENYSGQFYGPTRMREALIKSRNLVSIRLLRSIGIGYAIRYAQKFGFDSKDLPRDLSLALGSGAITPLDITRAYATFANNGYKIKPYFIDHIIGPNDNVISHADPLQVCPQCQAAVELEVKDKISSNENDKVISEAFTNPQSLSLAQIEEGPRPIIPAPRVLKPQTAFLATTMLRDVIRFGTGRRALQIGRKDLAGKTGTTNDQRDAWFTGFNTNMATTAWVGFNTPKPLGTGETGAQAALPMWIDYMKNALQGIPEIKLRQPSGLISVRIDTKTGRLTTADNPDAIFEYFREDQVPIQNTEDTSTKGLQQQATDPTIQIF